MHIKHESAVERSTVQSLPSYNIYDVALQAMEQRYNALADVHGKLAAEKDQLLRENESLREVGMISLLRDPRAQKGLLTHWRSYSVSRGSHIDM